MSIRSTDEKSCQPMQVTDGSLPNPSALVDRFGRVHTNLRISVTDRCNIRCVYCMPEEVRFLPRAEILSFEEIERVVRIAAGLGVTKIRLTGGEPLIRAELPELIARLVAIAGIREIALTTNGLLLAEQARALREAGLHRLNISLDTLREDVFFQLSRRTGLNRVLAGIDAAAGAGFGRIRLNAVIIRGLNESEIVPLVRFARERGFEMRFIEFMPLDGDTLWTREHVVNGEEIRRRIEAEFGPVSPVQRNDPSQPASDYRFLDGNGTMGLINPVSLPFCSSCNRVRLTAEGKLRNCLFSTTEWDIRALLRAEQSDDAVAKLMRDCVLQKKPGHGIDSPEFLRPERAMYQIGG